MRTNSSRTLVFCLLPLCAAIVASAQTKQPVAETRPVTDSYFGTSVPDPYRYMENTKDPQVQTWFKAQADYTRTALDAIPGRAALLADIEKYGDAAGARVGRCSIRGNRYFYSKRNKGEQIEKLYVRESLNAPERLLFDPMAHAPAGTHIALAGFEASWDGKWIAVGAAAGGSEDSETRILDAATGAQIDQSIPRTRFFGLSWLPDNSGFLYNQLQEMKPGMPETELEQRSRVFLHRLHAPGADPVIFGNEVSPEVSIPPALLSFAATDPDSHYVLALANTGVSNNVNAYVADLKDVLTQPAAHIHWTKFADITDPLGDISLRRDVIYFTSSKDAPNYRVLKTPAAHPDMKTATVVIPEQRGSINAGTPGSGLIPAADALYVFYLEDGLGKIMRMPYGGIAKPIPLPFSGAANTETADPGTPGLLFFMTTWTRYGDIFAYSPATGMSASTGLMPQGPYDNPTGLVSEEVEAPAKDGVMVPLSIVHRKDIPLDGKRPTILDGYGSYGISSLPDFGPVNLAWFDRGGVLAYAHVRGGGERGESWHLAGQKATKPNTWNDGIACAEYLIAKKYTSPATLAIEGGSAGGLFVGRSITERPDLFAAAIDQVPMSDALRVEFTANGVPNIEEFGTVKTEPGFKALYAMSPYHHVSDGTKYPAVLITTGANDPRVDPSQPAKFAARLQAATTSSRPILLRVDYDAGHGGIGSTHKQAEELRADYMSFALWQFGDPAFQPHASSNSSATAKK